MKLQEVFDQLSYGELSQIGLGSRTEDGLLEENYPALVSHVNLGLSSLYKRFNLKERRLNFLLQANASTYKLQIEDILKIERVYTDLEFEVSLNDLSDPFSCLTPSMDTLQVPTNIVEKALDLPDVLRTNGLTVVYRANHPRILLVGGTINPNTVTLELPRSYMEALLYFVASRVTTPSGIGGTEGKVGMEFFGRYEAECQKLEAQNLRVDQGSQSSRLKANGWV